jgi:Tfp pilus assembly protein PilN
MSIKYTINLVRQIRLEERKLARQKSRIFTLAASCMGVLMLACLLLVSQILSMKSKIAVERQVLNRIEMEYGKYRSTRMVIDKADIERLDSLQSARIFWTKKIAAIAYYLPENYWITSFKFDARTLGVQGNGYISGEQEQLITLDDYLNKLRADSTYNDVFKTTYFNVVNRSDAEGRSRVVFEYSSLR